MAAVRLAVATGYRGLVAQSCRVKPCHSRPLTGHKYVYNSWITLLLRPIHSECKYQEHTIPSRREYVESSDPEEWKFVERLMPPEVVPDPAVQDSYPSGWKPPNKSVKHSYFIGRTKNHMPPIYLQIGHRGIGHRTYVKQIKGDIWALEEDLRTYLEEKTNKIVVSQVNEMCGWIVFRSDYVRHCTDWALSKGF